LKLVRFYREGELSSIRVSNTDEAVSEVKNLFFEEQLSEEKIVLEIYSRCNGNVSEVDELRLDFDRIFSKKQLKKRSLISGQRIMDSADYGQDFSISTILSIKNEQRYLNATFRGFMVMVPRKKWLRKTNEPLLFASLRNNNFYLLNQQADHKESTFNTVLNWIKKGISFKTSSK
jgi:hypothetical protein